MKCPCCYLELEYKPVKHFFICSWCKHKFRLYENATKFHTNAYRNLSSSQRTSNEFDKNGVTNNFHKARQWISDARKNVILPYLREDDTILDIGSGGGSFAKTISNYVNSVDCLELDPRLIAECERLGFNTYSGSFLDVKIEKKYSVVTSWHVLEHVEYVDDFITKILSLEPRVIFLEVPINRELPVEFDGHMHMFNRDSFHCLLAYPLRSYDINIIDGIQKPAILAVATLAL